MAAQGPVTSPCLRSPSPGPAIRDFDGETRNKPITLSGARLAVFLAWKGRTMTGDPVSADGVRYELRGFAEILRGLEGAEVDTAVVLPLLATIAKDLAARLAVADDAEADYKAAYVTIGAPPAVMAS